MRNVLTALALTFAAAEALAGPADFFLGRPPSVGVVQGGAFGADGSDYLGEIHRDRAFARPARARSPARRTAPRLTHAVHPAREAPLPVVARPYRP